MGSTRTVDTLKPTSKAPSVLSKLGRLAIACARRPRNRPNSGKGRLGLWQITQLFNDQLEQPLAPAESTLTRKGCGRRVVPVRITPDSGGRVDKRECGRSTRDLERRTSSEIKPCQKHEINVTLAHVALSKIKLIKLSTKAFT